MKYLHSLVFKLDDDTYYSIEGALLSFLPALPPGKNSSDASLGFVSTISRGGTSQDGLVCEKRVGGVGKKSDGLSHFINEFQLARSRFENGVTFWRPSRSKIAGYSRPESRGSVNRKNGIGAPVEGRSKRYYKSSIHSSHSSVLNSYSLKMIAKK